MLCRIADELWTQVSLKCVFKAASRHSTEAASDVAVDVRVQAQFPGMGMAYHGSTGLGARMPGGMTPGGMSGGVPMAAVGVDTTGDGRVNTVVSGVDLNRDGIPDQLQVLSQVGG